MKRFLKTLSMGLAVSMLLAACGSPSGGGSTGGNTTGGDKKDVAAATSAIEQKHPAKIENEGTAVAAVSLL